MLSYLHKKRTVYKLCYNFRMMFLNVNCEYFDYSFIYTGDISVYGQKSTLSARDLWPLRQHSIRHRHDSVMEITAWAQEHFQKSPSVNTVHCSVHIFWLKLYHAKKKAYVNMNWKLCRLLRVKAYLKLRQSGKLLVVSGQTNRNLNSF